MKFLDYATLHQRRSIKWTAYDEDVIPLWIAESDFPTAPELTSALHRLVDCESFGYAPQAVDVLGRALSDFYYDTFGWRPDPTAVRGASDVVRAIHLAVDYLTRPHSAVVVPVPAYPQFLQVPRAAGRELRCVPTLDFAAVEREFAAGAGAIIIANPNNPLGFCYSRAQLEELIALADTYGARVILDEIHAPVIMDGTHVPGASLSEAAARACITITATSKGWNIAGLKCAQLIFSNPQDVVAWDAIPPIVRDGYGILGVYAAAVCYGEVRTHLDTQREVLRENLALLEEALPEAIPGIRFTRPQATYLLWLDFSHTALAGNNPAAWLVEHAKVALNAGELFGPEFADYARLNFGTSPDILREAVARMQVAVATLG